MITIVDYGMGNLMSVSKAFEFIGETVCVSNKCEDIVSADRLVIPGVGAFGDAMAELNARTLVQPIHDFVATGKPLLGICLGLQLFLDSSEESPGVRGLGLIPGKNILFTGSSFEGEDRLKVPQMGWNTVSVVQQDCPLLKDIKDESFFYFVHSYYAVPDEACAIAGETQYGVSFASMVCKDNVYATQFHPEKSQNIGLELLKRFCAL